MPDVLTLKDGNVVTLLRPNDLEEHVYQYMGKNTAVYVRNLIENLEAARVELADTENELIAANEEIEHLKRRN